MVKLARSVSEGYASYEQTAQALEATRPSATGSKSVATRRALFEVFYERYLMTPVENLGTQQQRVALEDEVARTRSGLFETLNGSLIGSPDEEDVRKLADFRSPGAIMTDDIVSFGGA